MRIKISFLILALNQLIFEVNTNISKKYGEFNENFNTIFVFEMNRHGARSHYMKNPKLTKNFFGEGVEPGYITDIGRVY